MTATVERHLPKLWAHFIEPEDLWRSRLPRRLAELVPRTEKDPDGRWESIHVDGQVFRRRLPSIAQQEFMQATVAAAGARDVRKRLADLDDEGIWSELVFPSLGMWSGSFRTPELLREAMRASNDWSKETLMDHSPRLIPTAQVSTLDIDDAIAELERCGAMGFKAVFLPVTPHPAQRDYHREEWEPFWATAEDIGMVIAFHIGTEPIDFAGGDSIGVTYHGPGGAVLNYTETSFGGQRAVVKLVASGALDRHPNLPGAGVGRRRHLGTVHRRPDGGGLSAARDGGAAQAQPRPTGDHLLAGVRVVPARLVGDRGDDGDGFHQRAVGQ